MTLRRLHVLDVLLFPLRIAAGLALLVLAPLAEAREDPLGVDDAAERARRARERKAREEAGATLRWRPPERRR